MKASIILKRAVLFSLFILGLLAGAALTTIVVGSKVDKLYYENQELQLQLENTTNELSEVKDALSTKSKGPAVTTILPEIIFDDRFSPQETKKLELTLSKEIIEQYKPLIGKPIQSLEPSLLPQIIDGRIIEIEQKQYELSIKTIVLSETLFIQVEVK